MNRTKIAQLYADADAFAGKTVTVAGCRFFIFIKYNYFKSSLSCLYCC